VGKRRRAGRASAARTARSKRPPGHAAGIKAARPVVCGVITVSDTRRGDADTGGALVERLIGRAGHRVAVRAWVRDDAREIRRAAGAALARRDVDCVILTGGTGLSPRDRTPESLAPLAEKWLPGFGELFRVLSLKQVGAAAWLSRAAAFVARGKLVVTLPGSTAAVELAMKKLLLPELAHTLRALGRFSTME
jgi:molybdenum cofactor biosynthesis protein B